MSILEHSIPYHPVLDVVRLALVFLAVVALVYVAKEAPRHHLRRHHSLLEMSTLCALAGLGLVVLLQELERLGDPMLWWRLPLLGFIIVNGSLSLWALHRTGAPGPGTPRSA